jgi:hypothetical protein
MPDSEEARVHVAATVNGNVKVSFSNICLTLPASVARELGVALLGRADKSDRCELERIGKP